MDKNHEFLSTADLLEGQERKSAAAVSITSTALLGTWVNCDKATRGLAKIIIATSGPGVTIHSFGACTPAPCDWGTVPGVIYASDVSSIAAVAFSAQYQFAFKRTMVVGHLDAGSLLVETFDQFTDGSGRSNYYSRYYLCKCTTVTRSPWPVFQHDERRTGLSTIDTGANTGKVKWQFALGGIDGTAGISPVIGGQDTIYIGSSDKGVYALNPDGSVAWNFTGANLLFPAAVAMDGTIYFGGDDNNLYALQPDGTVRWKSATGKQISSGAAIGNDGTIYIGSVIDQSDSGFGALYAFDPDGSLRWTFLSVYPPATPAIGADGTIYFAGWDESAGDERLYGVRTDGSLRWSTGVGRPSQSPAISGTGVIYVGGFQQGLCAFDPSGSLLWQFRPNIDEVGSPPAIGTDGTIYFGSNLSNIYALDPNGTLLWKFNTGASIDNPPAIGAEGTVYLGSGSGYVYAINGDGTLKWQFDGLFAGSPAISTDGTLYFTANNSDALFLYALS